MRVRPLVLLPLSLLLTACPDGGIGRCNDMRDISGQWRMVVQPAAIVKPGVLTIPRATMLTASFAQQPSQNVFGLGSPVWGEIVADDPGFFGRLEVARLLMNDGSKTGAALGCKVTINVPIATPVTDDDLPQLPNRLSLAGKITGYGNLVSTPELSTVIMVEDPTMTPRQFDWTGTFVALPPDLGTDLPTSDGPPRSGRKPLKKKKRRKGGQTEPDPKITGPVSVHLVALDPDRRRVVLDIKGLGKAPKANYITFTDDRARRFVGVGVDCAEPEGGQRRCEVELPPGYERRTIAGIELHLRGLQGPTARVPAADFGAAPAPTPDVD